MSKRRDAIVPYFPGITLVYGIPIDADTYAALQVPQTDGTKRKATDSVHDTPAKRPKTDAAPSVPVTDAEQLALPVPDTEYTVQEYVDDAARKSVYFVQLDAQLVYDDLHNVAIVKVRDAPSDERVTQFKAWLTEYAVKCSEYALYRVKEVIC